MQRFNIIITYFLDGRALAQRWRALLRAAVIFALCCSILWSAGPAFAAQSLLDIVEKPLGTSSPAGPIPATVNDITKASTSSGLPLAYDAWIYPDAPGVARILQGTQRFNALKAEYLHVNDDGTLAQINQDDSNPNGYSETNVALLKSSSAEQYITVSGNLDGTTIAMQNAETTINTMATLANKTGFGIELDWEDFGQWSPAYYQTFKGFLQKLGSRLHADGHKLMLDGPPIYDANSQGWYQWKYEELAPLSDYIVMMAYDNQYDNGVGSAISPHDWLLGCLNWLHAKAGDKGIAGIAANGYTGNGDTGRITDNDSGSLLRRAFSALSITRNAEGELTAWVGSTFYDYSDSTTLDMRRRAVEQSGLPRLSVWSLGNNPWF
ncbi:MAG TPA: glycosyl hydrolase family 18 protein [Candidatus Saccharimonadales bacterium]|nr:glycosyl hydrolase family 18 protein [Candidatus Saccharimonadales bacterium]